MSSMVTIDFDVTPYDSRLYSDKKNEYKATGDTLYPSASREVESLFTDKLYENPKEFEMSELIKDMKDHIQKVTLSSEYGSFGVPKSGFEKNIIAPARQAGKSLASTINSIFQKFLGGANPFNMMESYLPENLSDEEVFGDIDNSKPDELYHE